VEHSEDAVKERSAQCLVGEGFDEVGGALDDGLRLAVMAVVDGPRGDDELGASPTEPGSSPRTANSPGAVMRWQRPWRTRSGPPPPPPRTRDGSTQEASGALAGHGGYNASTRADPQATV
jgi:hypothetical protein